MLNKVKERLVEIDYVNWQRVRSKRLIRPVRLYFGSTEYHHESQWLLEAFDQDKQAGRTFAMKDILKWGETNMPGFGEIKRRIKEEDATEDSLVRIAKALEAISEATVATAATEKSRFDKDYRKLKDTIFGAIKRWDRDFGAEVGASESEYLAERIAHAIMDDDH